MTRRLV